jgi:hypothetical protein
MVGEPSKELGFASDLESKVKRFARIENFLHHLPHLIHFDRKNATVRAFVASGFDGVGKSFIDGADAVAKQIVETDEEGIVQTAFACTGGYFQQIDLSALGVLGANGDVSSRVDSEIATSPSGDSVGAECGIDRPRFRSICHRVIDIRLQRKNATIPASFRHLATAEATDKVME